MQVTVVYELVIDLDELRCDRVGVACEATLEVFGSSELYTLEVTA